MKLKFYKLFKKIIVSFLIINSFNYLCSSFLAFIPINVITIFIIAILGIPGIIALNLLYIII